MGRFSKGRFRRPLLPDYSWRPRIKYQSRVKSGLREQVQPLLTYVNQKTFTAVQSSSHDEEITVKKGCHMKLIVALCGRNVLVHMQTKLLPTAPTTVAKWLNQRAKTPDSISVPLYDRS
jgi:hypothetical protein